jgi:hypothetical protein
LGGLAINGRDLIDDPFGGEARAEIHARRGPGLANRIAKRILPLQTCGDAMRYKALGLMAALAPGLASAAPADASRFDGAWTVTVTCPDASGAMGFSYQFPGEVKAGQFHAERRPPGEAGRLTIDGPIAPDGAARLFANGVVGASQFAVGQRPKGTEYAYHIDAHFDGDQGAGKRIEGRPCDLTFRR